MNRVRGSVGMMCGVPCVFGTGKASQINQYWNLVSRRGVCGDEEVELGYQATQGSTLKSTAVLERRKQPAGDDERTLNLYFVSTPSYTLFAETFSNPIANRLTLKSWPIGGEMDSQITIINDESRAL